MTRAGDRAVVLLVGGLTPTIRQHVRTTCRAIEVATAASLDADSDHPDLADVRALVTSSKAGVPLGIVERCPRLEVIVNFGVGCDRIDLEQMAEAGIGVSNTPDVLTDCVADAAVGLLICLLRGFVAADRFVRAGAWSSSEFPPATKVTGSRIGIVGAGRIGHAVKQRLAGFDTEVVLVSRDGASLPGSSGVTDLAGVARWADALVVTLPGGRETQGLVSRRVMEALGDGVLINVSRGSVVDQDALVELLVQGRLGGAGLDVYVGEPQVPEDLLDLPNVVLLPHIGAATVESRAAMSELAIANLDAHLTGQGLITPVNTPSR